MKQLPCLFFQIRKKAPVKHSKPLSARRKWTRAVCISPSLLCPFFQYFSRSGEQLTYCPSCTDLRCISSLSGKVRSGGSILLTGTSIDSTTSSTKKSRLEDAGFDRYDPGLLGWLFIREAKDRLQISDGQDIPLKLTIPAMCSGLDGRYVTLPTFMISFTFVIATPYHSWANRRR